jgi:ferritin-like metal-binding protein YciE
MNLSSAPALTLIRLKEGGGQMLNVFLFLYRLDTRARRAGSVSTLHDALSSKGRDGNSSATGKQLTKGNMKLDTLKKLYIEELRDVYSAENQLVKALPKMAKGASSDELKQAFETHLEQTKGHVERLEEIFEALDEKPTGKTCKAMQGLIEEGSEMLAEEGEESVIDAGLIGAAQRVEHYEIAAYGTLRGFAELLGEEEAVELLQQTLDEEGETDKLLTDLAEDIVNPEALSEDEGEAEDDGKKKKNGKRSAAIAGSRD